MTCGPNRRFILARGGVIYEPAQRIGLWGQLLMPVPLRRQRGCFHYYYLIWHTPVSCHTSRYWHVNLQHQFCKYLALCSQYRFYGMRFYYYRCLKCRLGNYCLLLFCGDCWGIRPPEDWELHFLSRFLILNLTLSRSSLCFHRARIILQLLCLVVVPLHDE